MRTIIYTTWDDRQRLCAEAEAQGEQMLHDEVRETGGTKHNVLVFDWPAPNPPPAPLTERQVSQARIEALLAIPRSDWTAAQMRELIQLVAER